LGTAENFQIWREVLMYGPDVNSEVKGLYFFFLIVSKSIKCNIKEVAQNACHQDDLYLTGHDSNERQCAMEWPTTVWQHCFTNI
jgi:hypothetical protein